jgi:hypothetical protein
MSWNELVEQAHRDLDLLARAVSGSPGAADALEAVLDDSYGLGKAVTAAPALYDSLELRRFLHDAVPVIKEHHVDLMFHPMRLVHRFEDEWQGDEWEQLCVSRSALQFFADLFRDTPLADNLAGLESAFVDDFIRSKGHEGHLSDSEIPVEIPAAHWWWWYPEAPSR